MERLSIGTVVLSICTQEPGCSTFVYCSFQAHLRKLTLHMVVQCPGRCPCLRMGCPCYAQWLAELKRAGVALHHTGLVIFAAERPVPVLGTDCCDGTDEVPGRCMNTCLEAGASARAELKARAAAYAAGAKVREGYIKRAAKTKADWQAQLKRVSAQTTAQQQKVDQAKGVPPILAMPLFNSHTYHRPPGSS